MMISIQIQDSDYVSEIQYVIDFINDHPLLPDNTSIRCNEKAGAKMVHYGHQNNGSSLTIPAQQILFNKAVVPSKAFVSNTYEQDGQKYYSVEKGASTKPFFSNNKFGFDIIETIFFHISRYEEYHCPPSKKDQWDMMWEKEQFLVKHNLHHIPVVDQLVKGFLQALGLQIPKRISQYSMTHDIDVLQKFKNPVRQLRSVVRATLDKGVQGLTESKNLITKTKKGNLKDPYDTFDRLFTNHPFDKKICYVMAGGETKHDNYYVVDSEESLVMMDLAQSRGYEIGLHASYNANIKEDLFLEEKNKIESITQKSVQYNRQHFLHFDLNKTPKIIEDSGIRYDSTLGYQRCIGFRCGTGFSYRLFNFNDRKAYTFFETPMVIMDGGLIDEAGQDLEKAKSLLTQFLAQNKYNTYITFNFHNTVFDPLKRDVEATWDLYNTCLDCAI